MYEKDKSLLAGIQHRFTIIISPPPKSFGKSASLLLTAIMHSSAACASCAMSTADESSYSAASTLNPYHISPLTHPCP